MRDALSASISQLLGSLRSHVICKPGPCATMRLLGMYGMILTCGHCPDLSSEIWVLVVHAARTCLCATASAPS